MPLLWKRPFKNLSLFLWRSFLILGLSGLSGVFWVNPVSARQTLEHALAPSSNVQEAAQYLKEWSQPRYKPKILLVFDTSDANADVAEVIKIKLTNKGYRVSIVSRASDALEDIRHQSYDLVISNMYLPDMLGPDFLHELKQQDSAMPTILASGEYHKHLSHYADADASLELPIRDVELLGTAAETLQAHPRQHEASPGQFPKLLGVMVEKALGIELPPIPILRTWDEQRDLLAQMMDHYQVALLQKGHLDVVRFLEYLTNLESDEGYRAELEYLLHEAAKENGAVPAVFRESPLGDQEYVVLKVEATGYDYEKQPEHITEITAVRYRGTQKIAEYRTLVRPGKPIPSSMVEKAGITNDMTRRAPKFREIAENLLDFLGDSPLVMHFADFHMSLLNQELARIGKGPLLNEVIDTVSESRKVLPTLPDHRLRTIWSHLGFDTPGELRGMAYLRMYHWVVQHIALLRKEQGENFYKPFLKQFAVSAQIASAKKFAELQKAYGDRVEQIHSWDEVLPFVRRHKIRRIFLDFDMTVFRSKGYYFSDVYFNRRIGLEGWNERAVNEYISHDDFLAGLGFFELMDEKVPEVLKELQAAGVEIIVWTARGTNPGEEEKIKAMFRKMGVPIEHVILCEGNKKKGMLDFYAKTEKGRISKRPPTLVIDDSSGNIEKVMTDPTLGHNAFALQAKLAPEGYRDLYHRDFINGGDELLAQGRVDDALGWYFNAYGLALEKAKPDIVEKVRGEIREKTRAHADNPNVRSLWLRMEEKNLAREIWKMPLPEDRQVQWLTLLPKYIAAIPSIDPEARMPRLVDVSTWAKMDEADRAKALESQREDLKAGRVVVPIGSFAEIWRYAEKLKELDGTASENICLPREYIQKEIPPELAAALDAKDTSDAPLMRWNSLKGKMGALEELRKQFVVQVANMTSLPEKKKIPLNNRAEEYALAIGHVNPPMCAPLLVDTYLFASKSVDPTAIAQDLEEITSACKQGRTIIAVGDFKQTWWFYGYLQEKISTLVKSVCALEDLTGGDIPRGFAAIGQTPQEAFPLVPLARWDNIADHVKIRLTALGQGTEEDGFFGLEVFLDNLPIGHSYTHGLEFHEGKINLGGFGMRKEYKNLGLSEIVLQKIRRRFPGKLIVIEQIVPGSERFLIRAIRLGLIDGGPGGTNPEQFREHLREIIAQEKPKKPSIDQAQALYMEDASGNITRMSGLSLVDALKEILKESLRAKERSPVDASL